MHKTSPVIVFIYYIGFNGAFKNISLVRRRPALWWEVAPSKYPWPSSDCLHTSPCTVGQEVSVSSALRIRYVKPSKYGCTPPPILSNNMPIATRKDLEMKKKYIMKTANRKLPMQIEDVHFCWSILARLIKTSAPNGFLLVAWFMAAGLLHVYNGSAI